MLGRYFWRMGFIKGSLGFGAVRAWVWLFGLGLGTAFWGLKAVVAVLQQHTERRFATVEPPALKSVTSLLEVRYWLLGLVWL